MPASHRIGSTWRCATAAPARPRYARSEAIATDARRTPFGYSVARGITRQVMRTPVTPGRVIPSLRVEPGGMQRLSVQSFDFVGCSRVIIRLGSGRARPDVRVVFALQDGAWRVTRVRLPLALSRQAQSAHPVQTVAQLAPG